MNDGLQLLAGVIISRRAWAISRNTGPHPPGRGLERITEID
jgi:hypothetical protein